MFSKEEQTVGLGMLVWYYCWLDFTFTYDEPIACHFGFILGINFFGFGLISSLQVLPCYLFKLAGIDIDG